MRASIALVAGLALVAACGSTRDRDVAPRGDGVAMSVLLPAPSKGMELVPESSLGALIDAFTTATDWTVLADAETRARLDATGSGIERAQSLPANEVHPFVEALLVQHGYGFALVSARSPRILRVASFQAPSVRHLRETPIHVPPGELEPWAREHPAFQLQVVLDAMELDMVAFESAIRPTLSEWAAQAIVPTGSRRTLVLKGFAPWLVHVRDTVAALDRAKVPPADPTVR